MKKSIYLFLFLFLFFVNSVHSYIGPGAGIAFVSSFFSFVIVFFLVFFIILLFPFRIILKKITTKKLKSKFKKVIVIGFDGLDPEVLKKLLDENKLPTFQKIIETGSFNKLNTTNPSISPAAWSSFATGTNPAKHSILDFFTRNPNNYMPELSSVKIQAPKLFNAGKFLIPIGKNIIKFLRKSKSYWKILSEYKIFNSIIRVPITFPPEKIFGMMLSAMCTPDLKGTQGSFTYYTSDDSDNVKKIGGEVIKVSVEENEINTFITGPVNTFLSKKENLKIELSIKIVSDTKVNLFLNNKKVELQKDEYTDWIEVKFKLLPMINVKGIVRFYLKNINPVFELYLTPINISPNSPAMPISYPKIFSKYLYNLIGNYATLGLAEDTWALNERVIDESIFLKQVYDIQEERKKMLFNSLENIKDGNIVCVFDSTDRIQHMFWRYNKKNHPANEGKDSEKHKNAIEDIYIHSDKVMEKVLKYVDKDTALFVISDHGFCSFERGINLNSLLYLNGFLKLKDDSRKCSGEWFENVDWKNTKAFAMGLTGIFINLKGREKEGIVSKNEESEKIKNEITKLLLELFDKKLNIKPIKNVFDTEKFKGPYKNIGPDLIVGYNKGYRASWENAVGIVDEIVITDNTKSWSGDHCIDYKQVPGVIVSNLKLNDEEASLIDIAPTILDIFGVKKPAYMDGKILNYEM